MTVDEVVAQIRAYSATWRSQGVTQVPIAWIDYWADQLDTTQRPYIPLRPYVPFQVAPLFDGFVPLRQAGTVTVSSGFSGFGFR